MNRHDSLQRKRVDNTAAARGSAWRVCAALAAGVLAGFGSAPTLAQTAAKPLVIVVPQPAGNPTDATARKLQAALQKELGQGQTVIVENLPGAGGLPLDELARFYGDEIRRNRALVERVGVKPE